MENMESLLSQILTELQEINGKLSDIIGIGVDNSITDVCNKLDDVSDRLSAIETNTM